MNCIKQFKSSENLSFLATFVIGFATHLFGFVNVLHNYDDIAILPAGSGTGVTSGRWFLTVLDTLFEKIGITFNLPYVNAVLFIFLISISVKYVICILEIKNYISAILIGAVFVTFPSATSTLFFKYTAVLYGVAVLCAVMAVWCVKKFKFGFIVSMILIACSLGIYQAYVPITISLMVILSLRNNLSEKSESLNIIKQGIKYVVTLISGIIVYYIFLKICLVAYNTQLNSYQGIDKMGVIKLSQLPGLLQRTFYEFFSIVFSDFKGISQTFIIRFGILLLGCICVGLIIFILRVYRKKLDSIVLTVLLCCIFPVAINFIVIMCPTSNIYTLMVYSFALIFTVPFLLLEIIEPRQFAERIFLNYKKCIKKVVIFVTLVIIFSYAYLDNLNYTQLYYTTQKTENYMSSLVVQVRMTEGFNTSMKWAFIGDNFQDSLLYDNWEAVPRYGGNETTSSLINAYSRLSWIRNYFGYNISFVDEEQLTDLEKNPQVVNMSCFPNEGSIQIVNDVVVIKLENVE